MPRLDEVNDLDRKLQRVEARLENARGASQLLENQVSRALDRLILKGQGLEDIFKAANDSLLASVNRMGVINPLVNQIFGSTRGTIGGANDALLGGIGSLIGNLFGGAPAAQPFSASQNQINAQLSDAVRRGSRLR